MMTAIIPLCLILGTILAYATDYTDTHAVTFEYCSGVLMFAGLALLGANLECLDPHISWCALIVR